MNQRIKRSIERKKSTGFSTFQTGGYVTNHSRDSEPDVRVPQKSTGDIKDGQLPGVAKASPFFKRLADIIPKTKAEEAKAIAEAAKPVEEEVVEEKDEETEEA